jgi:acetyltransferase-like isoleucine patch superfamily enzyme
MPPVGVLDLSALGLARFGDSVRIHELVRIIDPGKIAIGNHVIIDDFVMLQGGTGVALGDHVHIASFVSLTGGGSATLGNHCGIATGARVLTGTDLFDGSGLTGPTVPLELRSVVRSTVTMGDHAVIGANAVVHPGVTIGEGAIVGSGGVVLNDLEPWTINVGVPARAIRKRPRDRILAAADQLART